jgi:hypothetical protein
MNIGTGIASAFVLLTVVSTSCAADERDHRRGYERHDGWRGDIHRFHEYDLGLWRGGRWFHGRHDGRFGWWWIAGGFWYFYPSPVYPYPDPYVPPGAAAPLPGVPQQYWYYCANPAGYYPYVGRCATVWQAVPSNSPPMTAPSAPLPPAQAPAMPPSSTAQQYWYYCANPAGYYPTVQECRGGWQQVPANTPPGVAR